MSYEQRIRKLFKLIGKSFYSGAGVVVTSRDANNELHVLLGKRRFNPGRGKWSIPGGRKNRDDADFKTAAIREMSEEIVLHGTHELRPEELTPVFTFFSGVFNWRTYHLHVDNAGLPQATRGRDNEFDQLQWCTVGRLPDPLHWGVKAAVRKAAKRAPRHLLPRHV